MKPDQTHLDQERLDQMNREKWNAVDRFFAEKLLPEDPALTRALEESDAAGLPKISVAANQGKMLQLIALIRGARRILEIGTLGGYSTIWLARALPADGRLVTLEANPDHAEVARANIARAGLASLVEVRVGDAAQTLPQLEQEGAGPFDLIFIDADKASYPLYLEGALKLSAPGTVIVGDNVVRSGGVADPNSGDPSVAGVQRFLEALGSHPGLEATAVQTVGSKGHDGFALAVVRSL